MKNLSFMEKLLDGIEVEWMQLKNVAKIKNGKDWKKLGTGSIPVYGSGGIMGFVDKASYDKVSVLIPRKGSIKNIFYVDEPFWNVDTIFYTEIDENLMIPKFFYYFMSNYDLTSLSTESTRPSLTQTVLNKIQIPVPSIEIQAEIVRILDTFTELTTELTTELSARKKQYNYYREKLLSFEGAEVEFKTLEDITKKSYSGGTPKAGTPEYYEGGTIPWLRTQEVKFSNIESTKVKITYSALESSAAKWVPKNCVIVAISGATAGRSAINKIPLTTNQHCCCLEINPEVALYRYVFHWVSFNHENLRGLGQGARSDLNSRIIKNFKIPIPFADDRSKSLVEQALIVSILDKFDTLTNSITEGLPREIELRQKQYEYYRDLLLSFPKPEGVQ